MELLLAGKRQRNYIIKLKIDSETAIGGLVGRKCRCKTAKVLEIRHIKDENSKRREIRSNYDDNFIYKVGKRVTVKDWNDKPYLDCEKGIHFFITRDEAVRY